MVKWTDLKRTSDLILAVWPQFSPLHERWFMYELVDNGEMPPKWRDRYLRGEDDSVSSDHYLDRVSAIASAKHTNSILKQALNDRVMDPLLKKSLELKVNKNLQSKQRLQDEERLMLAEAKHRCPSSYKLAQISARAKRDFAHLFD